MSVDPLLECLFTDEVLIAPFAGKDFANGESFGADVAYKAHVVAKTEEVVRGTGDSAVATHRVVLTDRFSIDERDRITMPARFRISNPEIMAVREWTDEDGPHHTTVLVGPRQGANA